MIFLSVTFETILLVSPAVEQKRTEAVSRLAATLPLVGARIAQLGDSSAAALPLVGARTAQLGDSGQWIDSSLYHAVPVSKIKSIQNLKNIVVRERLYTAHNRYILLIKY